MLVTGSVVPLFASLKAERKLLVSLAAPRMISPVPVSVTWSVVWSYWAVTGLPAAVVAAVMAANTWSSVSVVATVTFWPLTVKVPAVTGVAIGSVATVKPTTESAAFIVLLRAGAPVMLAALASFVMFSV